MKELDESLVNTLSLFAGAALLGIGGLGVLSLLSRNESGLVVLAVVAGSLFVGLRIRR